MLRSHGTANFPAITARSWPASALASDGLAEKFRIDLPDFAPASSHGHCRFTFTPEPEQGFNRGGTDYFVNGRKIDFITLDDGEAPIEQLIAHINGKKTLQELKRTFTLIDGKVSFINNAACTDYRQGQVGTPDYSDLLLDQYISAIEVVNPMHSLWSDGRWNKLTMAHGCYWGKCTFCDISLDYIKNYEPNTAAQLVDRMDL